MPYSISYFFITSHSPVHLIVMLTCTPMYRKKFLELLRTVRVAWSFRNRSVDHISTSEHQNRKCINCCKINAKGNIKVSTLKCIQYHERYYLKLLSNCTLNWNNCIMSVSLLLVNFSNILQAKQIFILGKTIWAGGIHKLDRFRLDRESLWALSPELS